MKTTTLRRYIDIAKSLLVSSKAYFSFRIVALLMLMLIVSTSLDAQSISSWKDFKDNSTLEEINLASLVFANVPTAYYAEGDWEKRGDGEPIRVVITPAQLEKLSSLRDAQNIQVIKIEIKEMAHWSFLQADDLANLSATSNLGLVCVSIEIPMSKEALLENLNTINLDNTTPAFYQYSVAE